MKLDSKCVEKCQLIEDKGYEPCKGCCFYANGMDWPLVGFNAVLNAISDEKEYCECGAVHSGVEDMGRCEACGKII